MFEQTALPINAAVGRIKGGGRDEALLQPFRELLEKDPNAGLDLARHILRIGRGYGQETRRLAESHVAERGIR
jgi:hypothetical protein